MRPRVTRRSTAIEPVAGAELVTATNAKNEFGHLLEQVMRGGRVIITRHDQPKAVLLSIEDFNALCEGGARELDTLSAEFDGMLQRMQTKKARAGMKSAFDASPEQLQEAAVTAARKRR